MAWKCVNLNWYDVFQIICQYELQEARKVLDEFKGILREKNKELQKYEQDKKRLEKQNMTCLIEIKDLEHKIANIQKDSRDAIHKVI